MKYDSSTAKDTIQTEKIFSIMTKKTDKHIQKLRIQENFTEILCYDQQRDNHLLLHQWYSDLLQKEEWKEDWDCDNWLKNLIQDEWARESEMISRNSYFTR